MQIEVDSQQAQKIRELVAEGMTPDEAYRKVTQAKVPTIPTMQVHAEVGEKPKRANKYGAKKVTEGDLTFDSRKEYRRYKALELLQLDGKIECLEVHPAFVFEHNGVRIGRFTPDFAYIDCATGQRVVEDVKSTPTKTEAYGLRKKMLKAFHGIDLKEV